LEGILEIQTCNSFLHVIEVHIYIVGCGKASSRLNRPPNGHPRKASHLRHFWVFGSLQILYMPHLHGFEEPLNNQGFIRKHTIKMHIWSFHFFLDVLFLKFITICLRGELKRMKTGAERGELVTLLDEPYLAFLLNFLPSPPSASAVGTMSVVVTVAFIAAVVELSFFLYFF
jgi:hypothetical protein